MKVESIQTKKGSDWGQHEYISLYDYLGYGGGKKLGKQVADYCTLKEIKAQTRYIENPAYKGPVNLYPRWAYDHFFATKELIKKFSHIFVEKN